MTPDTTYPLPSTVDLTGLPEPFAREVVRLIAEERRRQAAAGPPPTERQSIIGMFAHLGLPTPTLEEFQQARREMWADCLRESPDPDK